MCQATPKRGILPLEHDDLPAGIGQIAREPGQSAREPLATLAPAGFLPHLITHQRTNGHAATALYPNATAVVAGYTNVANSNI